MFGQAVTAHNDTVASLNERYQSKVSAALQDPGRTSGDGSVTDARGAARAELQGEYDAAVAQLDADAEEVAGMLKQGVNASNVLSLTAAGLMPPCQRPSHLTRQARARPSAWVRFWWTVRSSRTRERLWAVPLMPRQEASEQSQGAHRGTGNDRAPACICRSGARCSWGE